MTCFPCCYIIIVVGKYSCWNGNTWIFPIFLWIVIEVYKLSFYKKIWQCYQRKKKSNVFDYGAHSENYSYFIYETNEDSISIGNKTIFLYVNIFPSNLFHRTRLNFLLRPNSSEVSNMKLLVWPRTCVLSLWPVELFTIICVWHREVVRENHVQVNLSRLDAIVNYLIYG